MLAQGWTSVEGCQQHLRESVLAHHNVYDHSDPQMTMTSNDCENGSQDDKEGWHNKTRDIPSDILEQKGPNPHLFTVTALFFQSCNKIKGLLSGPSWLFSCCTTFGPDSNPYLAQITTSQNVFCFFFAFQNVPRYLFSQCSLNIDQILPQIRLKKRLLFAFSSTQT